MNQLIDEFRGEYYFLSNYFPCEFVYNNVKYSNAEAAFQAQKVTPSQRYKFSSLSPNAAKKLGRSVLLPADWESRKEQIMHDVVKAKFSQNPRLRKKLLETGSAILVEGNTWNDTYWGFCNGKGRNKLGIILMEVRSELR